MKVKRDVGRIGGWGGGVESSLPSRRGWTRSYFNFNSGGVQLYFKAYFANFRTPPPPLQIIIAQSLNGAGVVELDSAWLFLSHILI